MCVESKQQTDAPSNVEPHTTPPPSKWYRYNSPLIQIILISVVCICGPSMYNALSGMGGSSQVNHEATNNANTALNTTFAVFSILGGGIFNLLGPRLTLFTSCITYVLYAGSFFYYNHHKPQHFAIFTNAVLGIGAGLLWAAQGTIITSYPPSQCRGLYISLFWCISNLGGAFKGLVPFAINYNHTTPKFMSNSAYITFICVTGFGAVLSLQILPPTKVVRNDGTCAGSIFSNKKFGKEAFEILKLFTNWKMLLLMPAAWASNFFCSYQFNNVNRLLFNLRTEELNIAFYWGAQMVGSVALGHLLDSNSKRRRKRGFVGIAVVAAISTVIWAGGLLNQLRYEGGKFREELDFKMLKFAGPSVLFSSYGFLDAIFQNLCYWIIGALSDDSETLSRYSGFYKGVQCVGAAVAWQVDRHKTPLMTQLVLNWGLTTISYPLLVLLIVLVVKDAEPSKDDTMIIAPSDGVVIELTACPKCDYVICYIT